jgi:hypothetical protein
MKLGLYYGPYFAIVIIVVEILLEGGSMFTLTKAVMIMLAAIIMIAAYLMFTI